MESPSTALQEAQQNYLTEQVAAAAASQETPALARTPREPMGFGKTVFAVVVGILVASVICWIVYLATVVLPQAKTEREQADREFAQQQADMKLANDERQLQNAQLEQQIKDLEPGSPCNVLTGDIFTQCGDLKTNAEKRKFAAAHGVSKKP